MARQIRRSAGIEQAHLLLAAAAELSTILLGHGHRPAMSRNLRLWRPLVDPTPRRGAMLMPSREARLPVMVRRPDRWGRPHQKTCRAISTPIIASRRPPPRAQVLIQQLLSRSTPRPEALTAAQPSHAPPADPAEKAVPGGWASTSSRASSLRQGFAVWGRTRTAPPRQAAWGWQSWSETGPGAWQRQAGTPSPDELSVGRCRPWPAPPPPSWPNARSALATAATPCPRLPGRLGSLPSGGSLDVKKKKPGGDASTRASCIAGPGGRCAEHRDRRSACRPSSPPARAHSMAPTGAAGCPGPPGRQTARQQHQAPLAWPGRAVPAGRRKPSIIELPGAKARTPLAPKPPGAVSSVP